MMHRSAEFSPDRQYRHRLDRWWSDGPRCGWLLCNPSIAGGEIDDPTVKKMIGFSSRWGFSGITVVNPFDWISTYPNQLVDAAFCNRAIATERNKDVLRFVANEIAALIVGWGADVYMRALRRKGHDPHAALTLMTEANPSMVIECLGLTKHGSPRHPLMLPYSTLRQAYVWEKTP